MKKPNYQNYGLLKKFLVTQGLEYVALSPHHYRILGDVAIVDVWPARMTVHVVKTEAVDPNRYFKLNYNFKGSELLAVLNGEMPDCA